MPGRMELDFVDPVAETIVRAEARRVFVGEAAPLERLTAQKPAERTRGLGSPAPTFAFERFGERQVLEEQIVSRKRWWLIQRVDLRGPSRKPMIVPAIRSCSPAGNAPERCHPSLP
jgi:hypothetical protein